MSTRKKSQYECKKKCICLDCGAVIASRSRWRIWWAGGCGCQARAAAGRLLQEPVGGRDQLLRISLAWSRLAMHNVSHQKAGVEEASDELNFFNYTRRII